MPPFDAVRGGEQSTRDRYGIRGMRGGYLRMSSKTNVLRFDDLGVHALVSLKKILEHYIGDPLASLDPATLADSSVSHQLAAKVGQHKILQEVDAALRRSTPT